MCVPVLFEMFYVVASFNLNVENFESLEDAERHYVKQHVPLAKRLPGLRRYLIGHPIDFGIATVVHHRAALLAFDDRQVFTEAYRTEIGRELRVDERRTIGEARIFYMDAEDVLL